jgi:hypothetical protein
LIKGGPGLQPGRIFMQTMTAFGSFKDELSWIRKDAPQR